MQELEAAIGFLFVLLCIAVLCSDMVENSLFTFFHCLYYDNVGSEQVSAGTTRV